MNKNKDVIYNNRVKFLSIDGYVKNPMSNGLLCLGALFFLFALLMVVQPKVVGMIFRMLSINIDLNMLLQLYVLIVISSSFCVLLAFVFSDYFKYLDMISMKAELIKLEFCEIRTSQSYFWCIYVICRYSFDNKIYEVRPLVNTPYIFNSNFYSKEDAKRFFYENCIDGDKNVKIWLTPRKPIEPIIGQEPNLIKTGIVYTCMMLILIFIALLFYFKGSF